MDRIRQALCCCATARSPAASPQPSAGQDSPARSLSTLSAASTTAVVASSAGRARRQQLVENQGTDSTSASGRRAPALTVTTSAAAASAEPALPSDPIFPDDRRLSSTSESEEQTSADTSEAGQSAASAGADAFRLAFPLVRTTRLTTAHQSQPAGQGAIFAGLAPGDLSFSSSASSSSVNVAHVGNASVLAVDAGASTLQLVVARDQGQVATRRGPPLLTENLDSPVRPLPMRQLRRVLSAEDLRGLFVVGGQQLPTLPALPPVIRRTQSGLFPSVLRADTSSVSGAIGQDRTAPSVPLFDDRPDRAATAPVALQPRRQTGPGVTRSRAFSRGEGTSAAGQGEASPATAFQFPFPEVRPPRANTARQQQFGLPGARSANLVYVGFPNPSSGANVAHGGTTAARSGGAGVGAATATGATGQGHGVTLPRLPILPERLGGPARRMSMRQLRRSLSAEDSSNFPTIRVQRSPSLPDSLPAINRPLDGLFPTPPAVRLAAASSVSEASNRGSSPPQLLPLLTDSPGGVPNALALQPRRPARPAALQGNQGAVPAGQQIPPPSLSRRESGEALSSSSSSE